MGGKTIPKRFFEGFHADIDPNFTAELKAIRHRPGRCGDRYSNSFKVVVFYTFFEQFTFSTTDNTNRRGRDLRHTNTDGNLKPDFVQLLCPNPMELKSTQKDYNAL